MAERYEVGANWVYRGGDAAPLEQVRVVGVTRTGRNERVVVEWVAGDRTGTRQDVPGRRLKALWEHRASYHQSQADWQRVESYELTPAECGATERAFKLLIDPDVADWNSPKQATTCTVHDRMALEALLDVDLRELIEQVDSLEDGPSLVLSGEGVVLLAEAACKRFPTPILKWVDAEERAISDRCLGRTPNPDWPEGDWRASPDAEYRSYRERVRPMHELLRQWCGHRAIRQHERLEAAEAEVHRLDVLLSAAVRALHQAGGPALAAALAREHAEQRITAASIRSTIEQPRPVPPQSATVRRRRWTY